MSDSPALVEVAFKKWPAMNAVLADPHLSSAARLVACFLVAVSKLGRSFYGLDAICCAVRLSRATVVRAIAELEHATGCVRVTVTRRCRKSGPGRQANVYQVRLYQSSTGELRSRSGGAGSRVRGLNSAGAHISPIPESTSRTQVTAPEPAGKRDLSSNGHAPEFKVEPDLSSKEARDLTQGILFTDPIQVESATMVAARRPKQSKPSRSETAPKKRSSTRKNKQTLPDDFAPDSKMYVFAKEELRFDRARVERELKLFKDHALTNDRHCADWSAALRMWLRRAAAFEAERHPSKKVQTSSPGELDEHRATRALLRANERNGVIPS